MDRRRTLIYATFVALVGALVFAPALSRSWIYDDHILIEHNPFIHTFHDWPRWFVTDFWNVDEEITRFTSRILYWRPAISASYALDWQVGGGSALVFHVTNLVLAAVAAALSFFTLRRWLGTLLPAAAAAALFVVHPTKAESIAWIAGRTDVVCLLAILVASAGAARRLSGRHGGIALEVAGTLLAYMAKEQAIVLPCFIAVEVWVALDRPPLDRATIVRMIRGALPQLALAIAYLAVRTLVMPISSADGSSNIPLGAHALAVAETMGRFVTLTVAPHDLSIQEGLVHSIHGELVHAWGYIALGAVSTLLLAVVAVRSRLRRPAIALGIALYFATIAPTSNLVYTGLRSLISERFLYLPLLGLALAAGALIALAEQRWGRRIYAGVAACVLALGIQSARRSADFRDEDSFWARELALHPDSTDAKLAMIARDLELHHFYPALVILQRGAGFDATVKEHLTVAYQVATLLARMVPDHRTKELEVVDTFCANLLATRPARLDLLGVQFDLDVEHVANNKALDQSRPRFLSLRADLQSRMGHDAAASDLGAQSVADCERCVNVIAMYALVLARGGRYADALAVLEAARGHVPDAPIDASRRTIEGARALFEQAEHLQGPAALEAHASELAKLELWGRAFDLLAPYETDIKAAPKFATGFAELAFRAGEEAIARRVLAASKSPTEIDALIAGWTEKMGWTR
ncbi:MAG: hypothetical protein ABJE66_24860 [Deltaproteobacteria bacterium]